MFTSKEFRAMARAKLKGHWGKSILVTLIATLLGGVSGGGGTAGASGAQGAQSAQGAASGAEQLTPQIEGFMEQVAENPAIGAVAGGILTFALLLSIALFIVGACVELGHNQYYIDLCNNRESGVGVLFSKFGIFLKAVGLRLYMSLFIFLWSLLFVIPGIVAAYRYAMAPYIMAQDESVGIREAVNRSKAMMQGRKWRLFCLGFSFIGWIIVGVFTLGIGLLWVGPYMAAATAAFYLDASGQGIPMEPEIA